MRNTPRYAAVAAVLAALALMTLPGTLRAQDGRDWNNASDPLEGAVGLHYGRVAGHGLSFRWPTEWFLYLQPTFGIWHTSEREQHNVGLGLHYVLRQDRLMRFYIGAGIAYFYDREMVGTEDGREIWEKRSDWNKGAGIGVERLLSSRVALQVEADFVHYGDSGDIKVAPQFGLYYYW